MELRPSLDLSVVAIEKGVLGSPSIKVANFMKMNTCSLKGVSYLYVELGS